MPANRDAAISLLGSMLTGIQLRSGIGNLDPHAPDFSLDEVMSDGSAVQTKVVMPSGDRYLVRVEWLSDESP